MRRGKYFGGPEICEHSLTAARTVCEHIGEFWHEPSRDLAGDFTREASACGSRAKLESRQGQRISLIAAARAEEDRDIPHARHQFAAGLFGDHRRECFLFRFEIGETNFHQFVIRERAIQAGEKFRGDAGVADFEHGVETLRAGFEVAFCGVRERWMRFCHECV